LQIGQSFNIAIISIYGPNENNREFYTDLTKFIRELDVQNIIIGGDWNSTWDISPPAENIDILNMNNLPSRYRSEQVRLIADHFDMVEPFRLFFPEKIDYTYIPNAALNVNRSRIDFFLVSSNLISKISDTNIETGRISTLFDHKLISINLGREKTRPDRNKICNGILDNIIIELTVSLAVKEFYLNNADANAVPGFVTNPIRYDIGRIYHFLKLATDSELNFTLNNNLEDQRNNNIAEWKQLAIDIAETLPNIEFFQDLPLVTDPANFFEGLLMSVKNEILSKQSTIYRVKNHTKKYTGKGYGN
jgi:hypothetical protein